MRHPSLHPHGFVMRMVKGWNCLPKEAVKSSSLGNFWVWLNNTLNHLTPLWRKPCFEQGAELDDLKNTPTTVIIPQFIIPHTGEPFNETLTRADRTTKYTLMTWNMSFPNKEKKKEKNYILPWKGDYWSKVRWNIIQWANRDALFSQCGQERAAGPRSSRLWREFGTVPLLVCSGKYPYSSLKLGIAVEMIKPPSKSLTS